MESRLSSFRISGGPVVRRVLTNHVDENISIGLPSLGNSEASAGLSVLTPFRSSLDNKPCIGRKGNQSRNRRDFPGAKVWPVVPGLSRASTSLLSKERFLMPQSAAVSALLKPAGISASATTTRRTSACARREGLSRAPPIPTTPTQLTVSS